MNRLRLSLICVVGPGIVWAGHFIAIYALISAACAPRRLLDHAAVLSLGAGATVLALILCLLPAVFARRSGTAEMRRAAFWSGVIFAMAVAAAAAALLFFPGCGG